jgi:hypothetical protein
VLWKEHKGSVTQPMNAHKHHRTFKRSITFWFFFLPFVFHVLINFFIVNDGQIALGSNKFNIFLGSFVQNMSIKCNIINGRFKLRKI